MIDATDALTRTLPGVPFAPPPAPKTTILERMRAQGYQGPKEGWKCALCKHVAQEQGTGKLRCQEGGFRVERGGFCRLWEQRT